MCYEYVYVPVLLLLAKPTAMVILFFHSVLKCEKLKVDNERRRHVAFR